MNKLAFLLGVILVATGLLVGQLFPIYGQGNATVGQYIYFNASTPATCTIGSFYWNTTLSQLFVCTGTNILTPVGALTGTTGTITGTLLAVGACDNGTATVNVAQVGMVAKVQASDGTALLPLGFTVDGVVTSANTVTVHVCADILGTPPSKTFTVRVIQ